jgi:hypothetical protein
MEATTKTAANVNANPSRERLSVPRLRAPGMKFRFKVHLSEQSEAVPGLVTMAKFRWLSTHLP